MSERRCEFCGHAPCLQVTELCEPQEGASLGANRSADSQDSAGVSTRKDEARGVPSCDSPELAAIRQKIKDESVYEDGGYLSLIEGRVLLRMVDELTKDRNEAVDKLLDVIDERDDLRAKLTRRDLDAKEAELDRDSAIGRKLLAEADLRAKLAEQEADYEKSRKLLWDQTKELRAKLAEAEKTNSMLVADNCELLKRAEAAEALAAKNDARAKLLLADREAAEARVRELETELSKRDWAETLAIRNEML